MASHKQEQSPYAPFVHRVLLPTVRSTVLALAVIAVGIGSWLETNNSITDCSVRDQLAFRQVSLLRNLSQDNIVSPDSVSFGLWRHCFIYALNCTCTNARLNYDLDAYTVLLAAVGNNVDIPEIRGTNSFVRVVPLLLATALCGLAFILGIIVDCSFDTTTRSWMQWFHAGIVLGSAAMVAIGFGYTQQEYTNGIRAACEQLDGRCASLDFGLEFILLVVGLCLMALAFLILLYYLPFGKTSEDGLHQKKKMSSVAMTQPHQNSSYGSSSEDALEAWRDAAAAMIDEQQQQESWHDYGMKGSLPPPPPQHSRHSSPLQQTRLSPPTRRRYSVQPENSRRYRRTTQDNSYMYNDGEELAPPSLPFAPSSPHERTRRTSQGSANTFGANNIMARNSRTSSMMDEFHDSRTTTTPTSMKPHPDADSFCITPVERSSGGSYDSVGQQQRRRSSTPLDPLQRRQRRRSSSPFHDIRHVPRLNMPPAAVHDVHPLNHKVITDKRISAYLQQRQQF